MKQNKFFQVLMWVFLCPILLHTGYASAQPSDTERINQAYSRLVGIPQLQNGLVSFTLLDGKTGEPVFSSNGKLGMATASTLKTITAATAMHILGPDYRFRTTLAYTGFIDGQGILHGNLIVSGSGDPSLGSHRYEETREEVILQRWVQAVKRSGIKEIRGCILADDLLFGGYQAPGGWPWRDMGNYYGAGVSSLNWRENSFGVIFQPARTVGMPATIKETTADVSYLDIVNEVITGSAGSGDEVYAFSAPYSSRIYFRGSHGVDLKKTIVMSLPDAAYDLVYQLKGRLTRDGVVHTDGVETFYRLSADDPSRQESAQVILDVHESPALSKLVYWFNQVSINLYGESLLKAIALKLEGEPGTSSAAGIVRDFWAERLSLPKSELRIADGSGLSPNNRITTHAMARILNSCQHESWFGDFYESLPTINGMKMKSGTISGVLGYTGYHTSKDGKSYVFSLLVSNYDGGAQAMRNNMFRFLDILK